MSVLISVFPTSDFRFLRCFLGDPSVDVQHCACVDCPLNRQKGHFLKLFAPPPGKAVDSENLSAFCPRPCQLPMVCYSVLAADSLLFNACTSGPGPVTKFLHATSLQAVVVSRSVPPTLDGYALAHGHSPP